MRSHNVSTSCWLKLLTTSCGYDFFICINNAALLPWWMSLRCCGCSFLLEFPNFTVCCHSCACLCAYMSEDKRVMDITMCFLLYSGTYTHACGCSCVFRSSPYLRGPDWSCRWTCRDLLRAAQGYFWTAVLLWDGLLEKLPFQNQIIFFLGLGGWIFYLAPGW